MSEYKKIIPCMDVKDGRVVKGVKFVEFRDAGDPCEFAEYYCKQGADELVFLDISATVEGRKTIVDLVAKVAERVTVPFAVGGGIASLEDAEAVLDAGADKISINSAAVKDSGLIEKLSNKYGSKRIIVAIDARRADFGYEVLVDGGFKGTGMDAVKWAEKCEALGAGEILLTSLDADGTKDGYDLEMTADIKKAVSIPVTASGGCGSLEDFYRAFSEANADAALAASLFHFGELTVGQVKDYLREKGINVKIGE